MDIKRQTYTVEELAKILGLSTKTIFRRIQDGVIRPLSKDITGAATRISKAEVDRLLGVTSEEVA